MNETTNNFKVMCVSGYTKYELILRMLTAKNAVVHNNITWDFEQLPECIGYNGHNAEGLLSLVNGDIVVSSGHTIDEIRTVYTVAPKIIIGNKSSTGLLSFALNSKCRTWPLYGGEMLTVAKLMIPNSPGSDMKVGAVIYRINVVRSRNDQAQTYPTQYILYIDGQYYSLFDTAFVLLDGLYTPMPENSPKSLKCVLGPVGERAQEVFKFTEIKSVILRELAYVMFEAHSEESTRCLYSTYDDDELTYTLKDFHTSAPKFELRNAYESMVFNMKTELCPIEVPLFEKLLEQLLELHKNRYVDVNTDLYTDSIKLLKEVKSSSARVKFSTSEGLFELTLLRNIKAVLVWYTLSGQQENDCLLLSVNPELNFLIGSNFQMFFADKLFKAYNKEVGTPDAPKGVKKLLFDVISNTLVENGLSRTNASDYATLLCDPIIAVLNMKGDNN